ncbi:MAG: hypothetical protein ACHQXA_06250 [Gemmatimonadales bacterium]
MMRATQLLGIGALTLGLLAPRTVSAQHVRVGTRAGRGAFTGRVIVGEHYDHFGHARLDVSRRPVRTYRSYAYGYGYQPAPRAVFIQRFGAPYGRAWGWWTNRGFVRVMVWEDDAGNYYDYADAGRPNLREVTVYERDGRYYQPAVADEGADPVDR